jgi:uncharacterized protein (DUF58 family)
MTPFDTVALNRLEIQLNHQSSDFLDGSFRGVWGDDGFVPSGVREYQPGDRMARVHRPATQASGRLHVWTAEPERAVPAVGVVDLGPSMYFGTALCSKIDIVRGAAFALGWLFSQRGNRMASVLVGEPISNQPFRSSRTVPYQLWSRLQGIRTPDGSDTQLAEGIAQAVRGYRKAEFAAVISDFQSSGWEEELLRLGRRRSVLCLQPLDPWELALPDGLGEAIVADPRTNQQLRIDLNGRRGDNIRDRYARMASDRQDHIELAIKDAGARHVVLRTDGDWVAGLLRALRKRR